MIGKIAAFLRFANKAERLMLAYKALGFSEEQTIARWEADLHRVLDPSPQTAKVVDERLSRAGALTLPTDKLTHIRRSRGN
jgi:hypothetical protein